MSRCSIIRGLLLNLVEVITHLIRYSALDGFTSGGPCTHQLSILFLLTENAVQSHSPPEQFMP